MTGRRGRKLEAVADGLIEISPGAIALWLLRTVRMANPNPEIYTQFRFGQLLGRDGTFVSHVEGGRRPIPTELREHWLTLIGLDFAALNDYLMAHGTSNPSRRADSDEEFAFALIDDALDGAELTPREWTTACSVAASIPLPRTIQRFCNLAAEAMATSVSPGYQLLLGALPQLPSDLLVGAIQETVRRAPSTGTHAVAVLGNVDAAFAGPALRDYLRSMPDPHLDSGVLKSIRKLVARGDLATVADDPLSLQEILVDAMPEASSWMARVEIANLARLLGPLRAPLRRQLSLDADSDVRLAVGIQPGIAELAAVRALRENAVQGTLDQMFGSPSSDPLAEKLVGIMMLGRSESSRISAAQALAMSPYRDRCVRSLIQTASSMPTPAEVRRSACIALGNLGPDLEAAKMLTLLALEDSDSTVRARATWSLVPNRHLLTNQVPEKLIKDGDEMVRYAAVDLAGAMQSRGTLAVAETDQVTRVATQASTYSNRSKNQLRRGDGSCA